MESASGSAGVVAKAREGRRSMSTAKQNICKTAVDVAQKEVDAELERMAVLGTNVESMSRTVREPRREMARTRLK